MTGRGENPVRRISASPALVFSKDIWPDAFLVPKICTHFAAEGRKFFSVFKSVLFLRAGICTHFAAEGCKFFW